MNITGYNQYKENSINTAQPEELTLMLYNGLVKFIMKSQYAISKKICKRRMRISSNRKTSFRNLLQRWIRTTRFPLAFFYYMII